MNPSIQIDIPINQFIVGILVILFCCLGIMFICRFMIKKNDLSNHTHPQANHGDLFNNILTGVIIFTKNIKTDEFIVKSINPAAERIDQLQRDSVIGNPLIQLFPYATHSELMDMCYRVWETGMPEKQEIEIVCETNIKKRYRDYYMYKTAKGDLVSYFNDITAKKRVEKKYHDSQKKCQDTYNRLNQLMPNGLISCDMDGHIIECNVAFQKMMRYTEEELLQKTHKDITGDEYHELEQKFIHKQILMKGRTNLYQKTYIRKDQSKFLAEIQSYLIKDDQDQPVATWSIIRDITERENNIVSLQKSKAYIQNILKSMIDMLIVTDLELMIKTVNHSLLHITGYNEEDLIGSHISSLIQFTDNNDDVDSMDNHSKIHDLFKQILENQTLTNYELLYKNKEGLVIPINFFGSIMVNDNEEIIGFVVIARDIREEKASTSRLIQAEKYATLAEVIPGVGHELSQPLNVIKIINQSLLRDIQKNRFEQEDLEQDLASVINEVNKMTEIIDHMRIFARSSKNMQKMRIDINQVIQSALRFFSQQLKNRTIEAKLSLADDLPLINADYTRLEQMMVNLITNARDSLERGNNSNKIIEISTHGLKEEQDDHEQQSIDIIIIEVYDNGLGLSEQLAKYIFEPHFIPGSPWNGTGMGVAISKKIVDEHDGKIFMENLPGQGTRFSIRLPVD